MATEIEKLVLTVESDLADTAKKINREVDQTEKELKQVEKAGTRAFKRTSKEAKGLRSSLAAVKLAAVAFIGAIAIGASKVIRVLAGIAKESINLAKVQIGAEKQLEAALASTNNQLGLSVTELKQMASALQNVTNFGDETIIAAQA
jgi:hypothetical protein